MIFRRFIVSLLVLLVVPGLVCAATQADWQFLEDGDRLRIRVFNRRGELEYDLHEVVRHGEVIIPLIGRIHLLNLSVRALRERIRKEFASEFMRSPFVHITMDRVVQVLFRGPFVPRMIEVPKGASLFEALFRLNWYGNCKTVRIHRGRFSQDFTIKGLLKGYESKGLRVGMRDGDIVELIL